MSGLRIVMLLLGLWLLLEVVSFIQFLFSKRGCCLIAALFGVVIILMVLFLAIF